MTCSFSSGPEKAITYISLYYRTIEAESGSVSRQSYTPVMFAASIVEAGASTFGDGLPAMGSET